MKAKKSFLDDSKPWILYECEKGRRWSSRWTETEENGKVCSFSGCLPDHKVKKVGESFDPPYNWFRNWEVWEESPVYKSIQGEKQP